MKPDGEPRQISSGKVTGGLLNVGYSQAAQQMSEIPIHISSKNLAGLFCINLESQTSCMKINRYQEA